MRAEFSEFSFGYSLLENLIGGFGARTLGPPLFPSQRAEARLGYDVRVDLRACPVFLQFKLSDKIRRISSAGIRALGSPHGRFGLLSNHRFQQHRALLVLESAGNAVFYAAPAFHSRAELSDAYLRRAVVEQSAFFRPSDIGHLPAGRSHNVAFSLTKAMAFRVSRTPKAIRLFQGESLFRREIQKLCGSPQSLEPSAIRSLKLRLLDAASELLSDASRSDIDATLANTEPEWGFLFVCATIYNVVPVFLPMLQPESSPA